MFSLIFKKLKLFWFKFYWLNIYFFTVSGCKRGIVLTSAHPNEARKYKSVGIVLFFRYFSRKDWFVNELMNDELFFGGMVDRRKVFSLISSRDHCQRSSPSRISDTPRTGKENFSHFNVEQMILSIGYWEIWKITSFLIWNSLFSFFSNALHKCLHLVLAKEKDFGFFLASQKIAELQRIKEIAPYSADYRDIVLTYSKEVVTLGSSYFNSYDFPICFPSFFSDCQETFSKSLEL